MEDDKSASKFIWKRMKICEAKIPNDMRTAEKNGAKAIKWRERESDIENHVKWYIFQV